MIINSGRVKRCPVLICMLRGTSSQDGHLIRFPEAGEKQDLTHRRQTGTHPENLPPAEGLRNGAANHRTDRAADERSERYQTHRRAAVVRDEHVSNDGRVQHIRSDRETGEAAGADEERGARADGGEDGGDYEEDVGGVHDGIASVDLGKGRDEEGAGGFTEFPNCDEQGARR